MASVTHRGLKFRASKTAQFDFGKYVKGYLR